MKLAPTSIDGLAVVDTVVHADARGSFARLYCADLLAPVLAGRRIAQINYSRTRTVGSVRGLHFQLAPHAEMKLVRCLKGRVWDVAVDLRAGSPTFLRWHAETLAPDTMRMIVIPEGFAHGFQVLEPDSELLYLHTAAYSVDAERAVRHDDPRLAIRWPLPVTQTSERDAAHPWLAADFTGVQL